MIIITKYLKNITKYLKLGKALIFKPNYNCKKCGYKGKLHRHGFYFRNVISFSGFYRIPILRLKCPICNKTCSILPPFLIPYYQYSFDVIFKCLYMFYVQKQSYYNIIRIVNKSNYLFLRPSNLSYFKKRMENAATITNTFFANFHQYYYQMNKPSPALILKKIKQYNNYNGNFNYVYFKTMPYYFFSKINEQS